MNDNVEEGWYEYFYINNGLRFKKIRLYRWLKIK